MARPSVRGVRAGRRRSGGLGRSARPGRLGQLRDDAVERLLRREVREERLELLGVERLLLDERRGEQVELGPVLGQDVLTPARRRSR